MALILNPDYHPYLVYAESTTLVYMVASFLAFVSQLPKELGLEDIGYQAQQHPVAQDLS